MTRFFTGHSQIPFYCTLLSTLLNLFVHILAKVSLPLWCICRPLEGFYQSSTTTVCVLLMLTAGLGPTSLIVASSYLLVGQILNLNLSIMGSFKVHSLVLCFLVVFQRSVLFHKVIRNLSLCRYDVLLLRFPQFKSVQ